MTIVERNDKLKHFITCLKCEVSGECCDANCPTQYAAGNTGEIIENLEAISKVLEQETVSREVYEHEYFLRKDFEFKHAQLLYDIVQIVKNNEYPEYIEADLVEYLESKGVKL